MRPRSPASSVLNADRRSVLLGLAFAAPAATFLIDGCSTAVHVDAAHTMLTVARDLFPHARLSDGDYVRAIQTALSAEHPGRAAVLAGIRDLDQADLGLDREGYATIVETADRLALLQDQATAAWFVGFRRGLSATLYDDRQVWKALGYEGSSWDKGGYLDRGYDDIAWLPRPRAAS